MSDTILEHPAVIEVRVDLGAVDPSPVSATGQSHEAILFGQRSTREVLGRI